MKDMELRKRLYGKVDLDEGENSIGWLHKDRDDIYRRLYAITEYLGIEIVETPCPNYIARKKKNEVTKGGE